MTRGQDFIKNAKCTHGHRPAVSNSAWCDLNKTCTVLKLHDMSHNPTKNPQSAQVTSNILKSLTGGKLLNLTDMHGNGLRLRVM